MENIYIQENKEKVKATGEVLEKILADREAEAEAKATAKAEAEAKATAKAALLNKLGITAEEAVLLLS